MGNLNFIKKMAFSLFTKGLFLLLVLATMTRAGTLVELPQADNAQNSEDNLECILKVLREFDERRNDAPLPEITHLYDHIQPGVDRNIDINTLLLQFFNLKDINDKETNTQFKPRSMITECNLNKAPFVTPKCPAGYQRYGCCKCVRMCDYTDSIEADGAAGEDVTGARAWTKVNYCTKKKAIRSEVKRLNGQERQEIGLGVSDYEILEEKDGEYVYVKNCPKDYKRVGNTMCVALCPLGWPDLGNKCLKQGQLIFFPFVWQPGDSKVVPKN